MIDSPLAGSVGSKEPENKIAEILIKNGADVNNANKRGFTNLMFAACYNNKEGLELLLNNGASINAKDQENKTALDYAIQFNCQDTAEILKKMVLN